jgi:predicted MPP superfamily phosphohydrolase
MSQAEKAARWPEHLLEQRIEKEDRKRLRDEYDESHSLKRAFNGYHYIHALLKLTGLYRQGWRTFMNPALVERTILLPTLPQSFDGFRILHLSDTHFDLEPRLAEVVAKRMEKLDYDACLVTGDFRDRLTKSGDVGVQLAIALLGKTGRPVYACLGNHDIHTDPVLLEAGGIRVLINESVPLDRGGERIYICGVDDPGYYGTDDFDAAYRNVPQGAFSILLAHDPGAYAKAATYGTALMLSGHTHAGQMCLPNGHALATHSQCTREMVHGLWQHGSMAGYTTSGVGGSRIAARFFTRGELAIHILRKQFQ